MSATGETLERLETILEAGRAYGHVVVVVRRDDLRTVVDLAAMLLPELRSHTTALRDGLEGVTGLAQLILDRLDDWQAPA